MTDTEKKGTDEKVLEKQNGRKSLKDDARISKRQMLAIWAALVTALGSQGIPAVVEMLDNKPDVADVQVMIAQQTAKLTEQQNTAVEAIKDLHADVKRLQEMSSEVAHVKGHVDILREVIRDCCTRRSSLRKLQKGQKPKAPSSTSKDNTAPRTFSKPIEQLHKVPQFDPEMLQQHQQQPVHAQVQEK